MNAIPGILFFGTIAVLCYLWIQYMNKRQKRKTDTLKADYDRALAAGDKKAALEAGRAYYAALRDGKLTIYDEQAISNDLAALGK